jgi:glyoxylase-like metal-dependent hydrolase (beta-lactamase superfamily II)
MSTPSQPLAAHPALQGLSVFERGWLSSNNLLVTAGADEEGATLIDASHVNHAEQTCALVAAALGGAPLARIVNTHLHSDHCGGNAALQRRFGAQLFIPPGQADAVQAWDESQLSHAATGQRLERFSPQGLIRPGEVLEAGGRRFEVLAAPGHDPDSVMLFDAQSGLLVSADALWEHGFGVVFPEVAGEPGFDDVGRVLDLIASLPVQLVVPGHGAPFTDVQTALARSRSRLQGFQREPERHARHAAKVLIKYHLMEERRMARDAVLQWAAATPLMSGLWERFGRTVSDAPAQWAQQFVDELLRSGALRAEAGEVLDA